MAKDKYTKEKCLQVVARDSRGGFGHIVHGTPPPKPKKQEISKEEIRDYENYKLSLVAKFETLMKQLNIKSKQTNEPITKMFNNYELYHQAKQIEITLKGYIKKRVSYTNLTHNRLLQIEQILKLFGVKND